MAHNINSMAYHGETPWHKLGKAVDHVITSAEAITAAGLDWQVFKRPALFHNTQNEIHQEVPDKCVTVRTDKEIPLGIVGKNYTPLQNKEAFSFFDAIVGEKAAMYHTAGALGKGEIIWLLAKLPGYIRTVGDDVSEKYLLLTNSHDGSRAVRVMLTPIRVVCQNTLNVALAGRENTASLRHSINLGMKLDEVRKAVGIISTQFTMLEEATQALADLDINRDTWTQLMKDSGVVPNDPKSTQAKRIMEEVSELFETGRGTELPGVRGTGWGAFNAIVEYVDYERRAKDRTHSLLLGSGAQIKQRAFDSAMALVS